MTKRSRSPEPIFITVPWSTGKGMHRPEPLPLGRRIAMAQKVSARQSKRVPGLARLSFLKGN